MKFNHMTENKSRDIPEKLFFVVPRGTSRKCNKINHVILLYHVVPRGARAPRGTSREVLTV